jgi:hypothetical protein
MIWSCRDKDVMLNTIALAFNSSTMAYASASDSGTRRLSTIRMV